MTHRIGFTLLLTAAFACAQYGGGRRGATAPAGDLLSEARATFGGSAHQETHYPAYVGGNPTNNWPAGTDYTIASVTGSGYVAHIWLAIGNYSANGLDALTMTIQVDGETTPRIAAMPMELFFARLRAGQGDTLGGPVSTRYVSWSARGVFQIWIPIPFHTAIRITLHNADTTGYEIWSQVGYVSTASAANFGNTNRLNVAYGLFVPFTNAQVFTLINATGTAGRMAGVYLCPDGVNVVSPQFAFLEGFVKIYTDGASTPQISSSGTEDYFLSNGYFSNGTPPLSYSDYSYLFYRNGWAIYALRWHILDPITFTSGLKVTWDAGETFRVPYTGTGNVSWVVWYYTAL